MLIFWVLKKLRALNIQQIYRSNLYIKKRKQKTSTIRTTWRLLFVCLSCLFTFNLSRAHVNQAIIIIHNLLISSKIFANMLHLILGDPGADSGDERKSKRAEIYMARRKVKNGEKSPWGQCLTRPVPNGRRRSGFWLVPENTATYFHPFRLSIVPTICPWVSEDGCI